MRTLLPIVLLLGACHHDAPSAAPEAAPSEATAPSAEARPAPQQHRDASTEATVSEVLVCLFDADELAQYVHAEVPGRVPVTVSLPHGTRMAGAPRAFGAPIEIVGDAALVEVVALRIEGDRATASVAVQREGVAGEVECTRADGSWRPSKVALAEH